MQSMMYMYAVNDVLPSIPHINTTQNYQLSISGVEFLSYTQSGTATTQTQSCIVFITHKF